MKFSLCGTRRIKWEYNIEMQLELNTRAWIGNAFHRQIRSNTCIRPTPFRAWMTWTWTESSLPHTLHLADQLFGFCAARFASLSFFIALTLSLRLIAVSFLLLLLLLDVSPPPLALPFSFSLRYADAWPFFDCISTIPVPSREGTRVYSTGNGTWFLLQDKRMNNLSSLIISARYIAHCFLTTKNITKNV